MAGRKITVVISQAPGKNPVKRQLEEEIATQVMLSGNAEIGLIPNVYDLPADHHSFGWMRGIRGDFIILSWLYERATRWTLDRNGICGFEGKTQLPPGADEDEEEDPAEDSTAPSGIGSVATLARNIYVMDLRKHSDPAVYLQEIERIARESSLPMVSLDLSLGSPAPAPKTGNSEMFFPALFAAGSPEMERAVLQATPATETRRRWYPVIDYSRCTNCMECIDFCLFGVYGVDQLDRILVEEQDNCKRGCPACSRVCPANAIIFPEHKSPAIAGAPSTAAGDFKINLSKLFGAPSALELAAQERDTELVADGRDAVGLTVGIPKRQTAAVQPRDDLDQLMDDLDQLDF